MQRKISMRDPAEIASAIEELNAPQAEAAAHVRGPLLVFAGAGSGKTRVITYRIANLVATERVAPYRILAVTFTNKAAGEMRARLNKILGEEIARDLWVGTFHATCAKLLRRFGEAVGLSKSFVIYDSSDQKALVTRVLRELDYDERRYPPRMVLGRIHKEKQEARGPEEMSLDSYMDEAIQKVYRRYEEQLQQANAVDFEDLILKVVKLLENERLEESAVIRRRFEHVLVDEFQDTNATQYRFLRALSKDHGNLTVVGDDDQSIYRWRGADVRNIRNFKKDWPGARVVKLEQNYRSSANIVACALGVIKPSREREPKELWTSNDGGLPVEVVATQNERDEAAHVVRCIQEAREAGLDLREMAVFYRINAQSRVLEEALRSVNLPYQVVGGMRFYERAEVKDALAYLRVLVNPQSDVDFLRIVNTPVRGIGQTTIDRLVAFATSRKIPVFAALDALGEAPEIAAAAQKRLAGLRDLLKDLAVQAKATSPADLLEVVLDKTGYNAALKSEDSPESDARQENLAELHGSMMDYEAEVAAAGETASLDGFLERVSLQSDVDQMKDLGKVTLMTVHGAKGLEFELVMLTGMEEEMFPYRGMEPGGQEEMEEERRLAYVAVTRAKKHLVITHTETRQIFGTTRWGRPSRFLADLPSESVEQKATRAASPQRTSERYVDRARGPGILGPWRHPQDAPVSSRAAPAPARPPAARLEPGERFVDRDFFGEDHGAPESQVPLRRGARVRHERFGEGEVRRIETSGEPAVIAFFPGWGEKKILARFLKLA